MNDDLILKISELKSQFRGILAPQKLVCVCGHGCSMHFALGCSKCDCLWFVTWEETDAEPEKDGDE